MNYQLFKNSKGLRVILAPEKNHLAFTILVLVQTGSKYETEKTSGISHFLEHLCFKGTAQRPSAFEIASALDGIGAKYNAFTSHEFTGYHVKADWKHFGLCLDIISDLFLNPLLDPSEIDRERGVITEEMNLYRDTPMRFVEEIFLKLVYGDQPAGWPIIGAKENILRFTKDDLVTYRDQHYTAKNTFVIVAGNVDARRAPHAILKSFASTSAKVPRKKPAVHESQRDPRLHLHYKATDQTHFILGFRTTHIFHKDRYPLFLLSNILGGGMSSRLFQLVREQLGAAYYIHSASENFTDHGILQISAGVDNRRAEEVVSAIIKEIRTLQKTSVHPHELKRAKDQFEGNLALSLETSDEYASFLGIQYLLRNKILEPKKLLQEISAVEKSDVKRVIATYLKPNRLNLALIGPFKEKKPFKKLLKIL